MPWVFSKAIDGMVLDGSGPGESRLCQALYHERSNGCLLKAVDSLESNIFVGLGDLLHLS